MYLRHYGLRERPFDMTTDAHFVYVSPSYMEAAANLVYTAYERKGLISILGDVGSGKTTILRTVLGKLDPEQFRIASILDPEQSFEDLLENIFDELGLDEPGSHTPRALRKFQKYLLAMYEQNRRVILVIDEAHRVPPETLERLVVLADMESSKRKLLQIVLCGHSHLARLLLRPNLRPLRERIANSSTIARLSRRESAEYIDHRLRCAGLNCDGIFKPSALRRIIHYAKGNPRTINMICDNTLITGCANGEKHVSWWSVGETIAEFLPRSPVSLRTRLATASVALLIVVGIVLSLMKAFPEIFEVSENLPTGEQPSSVSRSIASSSESEVRRLLGTD